MTKLWRRILLNLVNESPRFSSLIALIAMTTSGRSCARYIGNSKHTLEAKKR